MTKIVIITMVLTALSCQRIKPANDGVAVAQKMFDAFNKHEWQGMAAMYANDAMFLDPSLDSGYVHQTREQIQSKYAGMAAMFPDLHDEIVGLYPTDDKVIVEFVSTGTMNDSVSFKLPIVSVLTVKDGLIIKDATYYDLTE